MKLQPLESRSYLTTALEGVLLGVLLAIFAHLLGLWLGNL